MRPAVSSSRRLWGEMRGLIGSLPPLHFARYLAAIAGHLPSVVRTRSLVAADRSMQGHIEFRIWNERLGADWSAIDRSLPFDQSSTFGLARELYARNVYLRAFRRFGADGSAVVDLGGNRGMFSLLAAAALAPDLIVYVEPDVRYRAVMDALLEPYDSVVTVVTGVVGGRTDPSASTDLDAAAFVDLDRVIHGDVALLKIDIEGAEHGLITGAGPWLDHVERITMESHPALCDTRTVGQALRSRGFTVRPADAVGRITELDNAAFIYAARDETALVPAR